MEYFAARDQRPALLCREAVAASDVYVLVAGFQYGSPVQDDPSKSYTEVEFDAATNAALERLVFLLDDHAQGPRALLADHRYGARQLAFRTRLVESGLTVASVRSPAELETKLYQALVPPARSNERVEINTHHLTRFMSSYRQQVRDYHGTLQPPDLDRRRRVALTDLFVAPLLAEAQPSPIVEVGTTPRISLDSLTERMDPRGYPRRPGIWKTTACNYILHKRAADRVAQVHSW